MCRVCQKCIYTPYMTVYLEESLQRIPCMHHIYIVLANPMCVYVCMHACVCVHVYLCFLKGVQGFERLEIISCL